jgi:hypothetical protein
VTAAERLLWLRVQRRAGQFAPAIAVAILRAFRTITDGMSEEEIVRAIQFGAIDALFREAQQRAARELAYQQIREAIRRSLIDGVKYYARDLPKGGRVNGQLVVSFNVLNPNAIEAVRTLETRVITTLDTALVETVKQHVTEGIRDGVNPRTVARSLRSVLGIPPKRLEEIAGYRVKLENAHKRLDALSNQLRDRRYDPMVRKARATGVPLKPAQIDKAVEAYRKRVLAQNSATVARTAALDAQKLAQRLSWEDAVEKGIVDRGRIRRRWVGVLDERERPEHVAMEGEVVGFDQPFSNGELVPGDSTYNCRCLARMFVA